MSYRLISWVVGPRRGFAACRSLLASASAILFAACGPADEAPRQPAETPSMERVAQLRSESAAFQGRGISALTADDAAIRLGRRLFDAHCASCHGLEVPPARRVPDLRVHIFNYGANEQAVRTTISEGRDSEMPSMGHDLGEVDLGQLVDFVQSLEFESALSSYAERGKRLFAENCARCHGDEGLGDPEVGAPNLADGYWQHGDTMMNIRLVITRGVESVCPGYGPGSTEAELDLLTAFVLQWTDDGKR